MKKTAIVLYKDLSQTIACNFVKRSKKQDYVKKPCYKVKDERKQNIKSNEKNNYKTQFKRKKDNYVSAKNSIMIQEIK